MLAQLLEGLDWLTPSRPCILLLPLYGRAGVFAPFVLEGKRANAGAKAQNQSFDFIEREQPAGKHSRWLPLVQKEHGRYGNAAFILTERGRQRTANSWFWRRPFLRATLSKAVRVALLPRIRRTRSKLEWKHSRSATCASDGDLMLL